TIRVEIRPDAPFRLPRGVPDGVTRRTRGVLERAIHVDGAPVLLAAAQPSYDRVLIAARAGSEADARSGLERLRFALGVDVDVRPFLARFRADPVIGASVRRRPWLRVSRRPVPFEALAWAICEQLVEYGRAAAIERRIVRVLGRSCRAPCGAVLRDVPSAAELASVSPALLESFDLSATRAHALIRAAREVTSGRVDLHDPDHERGWRRLTAIRGIGRWTLEMLALHGQGREDVVPAGDLGLLRVVGSLLSGGAPRTFAQERDVRELFAPYGEWKGLAAAHLIAL
ncbi:MAG: DNA-3-methyladenine glycosylase family protein, partial [Solirubrobacteraceae bacterium]